MIRKQIGLRIKEIRKSKHLSQLNASLDAGLNRTYWADVESGRVNISIINLKKICDSFNISLKKFFDCNIFDDEVKND